MATMFQTVAQELADAFTTDTRDDGKTFYKLKDERAEWISKDYEEGPVGRAHAALDDRMPDDWVYEQCASIAGVLAEYEDADGARDSIGELVDGFVDTYNNHRAAWLASHLLNGALCDEAVEEYGSDYPEGGIYDIIGLGQSLALTRIANELIAVVESEAEEREDAATADE